MKEVKSRTGETELQPPEYVGAGPAESGLVAEVARLRAVLRRISNDGKGIPGCDAEYLATEALKS